jgi:hypothetical protein
MEIFAMEQRDNQSSEFFNNYPKGWEGFQNFFYRGHYGDISYHYNWETGVYTNKLGGRVSFEEVYYNFVLPNMFKELQDEVTDERTKDSSPLREPQSNITEDYLGVKGLTIINYYVNQSYPGQMVIDLSYTSSHTFGGNWTQWLTLTSEYSNRSFYDNGKYGQGDWIYYYSSDEIKRYTNGNTKIFHDNPYFGRTMTFFSTLSLVTPSEGVILVMTYGFSYRAGNKFPNTLYPLKVIYHKY